MEKLTELLTEINQIVTELKKLNGSNDLDTRWRLAEKLAANNFYLSQEMAEARITKNAAEYNYQSACSFDEATFTGPVTKAKAHAKNNNKEAYKAFVQSDGLYHRLSSIVDANKVMLESIRQSVAVLRNEQRNS